MPVDISSRYRPLPVADAPDRTGTAHPTIGLRLAGLQTTRINRALEEIGPAGTETVRRFLRAMIDRDDPDKVLETIFKAPTAKE